MAADPAIPLRSISAVDFALVAYQKIPQMERDIDEAKAAALAACGMAKEARDASQSVLRAMGLAAVATAQGPRRYESPAQGTRIPKEQLRASDTGSHMIVELQEQLEARQDAETWRSIRHGAGKVAVIALGGVLLAFLLFLAGMLAHQAYESPRPAAASSTH